MAFYRDKDIIEGLKQGKDSPVLKYLYDKVLPKISRYICRNSGTTDDAFDIFQDGVIILHKYIVTGRYREECELTGFLYTVCRNLWINKVKHERVVMRLPENHEWPDECQNILDLMVTRERENEVNRFLSELGQRCRELLQYVFYYQLSTKEICEKMGFANENTLKTKKYKCKQRLLEIISNSRN